MPADAPLKSGPASPGAAGSPPQHGATPPTAPVKPKSLPVPNKTGLAPRAPIAIPTITWSSAPPPIPPRSFSTPPPPPPSSPTVVTEPPPAVSEQNDLDAEEEEEQTRVQPDDIRRALEIRDEARVLLQQVLEEALAPLHYAVRDLERRLAALEPDSMAPPAPAPTPVAAPVAAPPPPQRAIPPPAVASVIVHQTPGDPFGTVVVAPQVPGLPIPPAPRAPSLDWEVPFDGARRRRRIGILFALAVVIVFGALMGGLIWSRVR